MYIGYGRLCVCLSLGAFAHYCTDPDVTCGNGIGMPSTIGVPSSCTLWGRFAIGAQVSLLLQHSAEREISASASTRSVPGYVFIHGTFYV